MASKKAMDDPQFKAMVFGLGAAFVFVVILELAMHLGTAMALEQQDVPGNPIKIIAGLIKGDLFWPRWATVIVVICLVLLLIPIVLAARKKRKSIRNATPVDDAAQYMGNGSTIYPLTAKGAREKAEQLGVRLGFDDAPGVIIGEGVQDQVPLYASYEDLHVDIWGPRQGKTTSRVIPAILDAIGPVIATSNKRDVVDATAAIRRKKGEVWLFDPQSVVSEEDGEPAMCWDPLDWVGDSEARAVALAGHFADSADDGLEASPDAFFDPEAEDMLAAMFLAASISNLPITRVYEWITNETNREPVVILRREGGYRLSTSKRFEQVASGLAAQMNADPRQRSGVYGTAKKMVRCLKIPEIQRWVTPNGAAEFDETAFVDSHDTLYMLSLEGRNSAAPLVSALTAAVIDAAMRRASNSIGNRLQTPMLAVLDEAANVVKWKDLPKQYSHFGSRGICVMTVLQSWAQGARCWGPAGMDALWSAATIKVLGSGIDDAQFLRDRSEAIGDYEYTSESVSISAGGRSRTISGGAARTFSVARLQSMPRGRAILFSAGTPPVLIKTLPWMDGPRAAEIQAAIEQADKYRHRTTFDELSAQPAMSFDKEYRPDGREPQPQEVKPL